MEEKRQYPRFQKQYPIVFSLKDNPGRTYAMGALLDISKGGLKFSSLEQYFVGTIIFFEIKFPFLYPQTTLIEGKVVRSQQAGQSQIYKISIQFINLSPQTITILEQMERANLKK